MALGFTVAGLVAAAAIGVLLIVNGRNARGYLLLIGAVFAIGWTTIWVMHERATLEVPEGGVVEKLVALVEYSPAGATFAVIGVFALISALSSMFRR